MKFFLYNCEAYEAAKFIDTLRYFYKSDQIDAIRMLQKLLQHNTAPLSESVAIRLLSGKIEYKVTDFGIEFEDTNSKLA